MSKEDKEDRERDKEDRESEKDKKKEEKPNILKDILFGKNKDKD